VSHGILEIAKYGRRATAESVYILRFSFSERYLIPVPQTDEAWARKIGIQKLPEGVGDLNKVKYNETTLI
jgi:hypothetical protein